MTIEEPNQPESESMQTIAFSKLNEDTSCVKVLSKDLNILTSEGDHVKGSSKVTMDNLINYLWEEKFYTGQLLDIHMGGKYIAYGVTAGQQQLDAVRVVNQEKGLRHLIKDPDSQDKKSSTFNNIEDISFAFIPNRVILATLYRDGSVIVFEINETPKPALDHRKLLHIAKIDMFQVYLPKRIFWCPFIPDDEGDRDCYDADQSQLLAVTRHNKIQLWNVAVVSRSHGAKPISSQSVSDGFLEIEVSKEAVTDAAFSPDGTAIATASNDGKCRFFQVYMQGEGEPRCLHEWEPHDGKPINSLLFLDNHKDPTPDFQYWKFALTGAKDNSEIKLWSCEHWNCLQTINLIPQGKFKDETKFKIAVDLSAGYIVLSDMYSRLLYVFEVQKDYPDANQPFVLSVAEFKLPCRILSFSIAEAGVDVLKPTSPFALDYLCENSDENQEEVSVKLYLIQPKSLQQCHIVFKTENPTILPLQHGIINRAGSANSLINLSEIITDQQNSGLNNSGAMPINLMTPDAFHSPAQESPGSRKSASSTDRALENQSVKNYTETDTTACGFVSAGSSPSREVQEILSSPRYYTNASTQEPSIHDPNQILVPKLMQETSSTLLSEIKAISQTLAAQGAELKALRSEINEKDVEKYANIETIVKAIESSNIKCSVNEEHLADLVIKGTQKAVSNAVVGALTPLVKQALQELGTSIQKLITSHLSINEKQVTGSINKMLRTQSVTDSVASTLGQASMKVMEDIYKESFLNTAVPLFNQAFMNMLKQVNEVIKRGIEEQIKEMEKFAKISNERTNAEIGALKTVSDQCNATMQSFGAVTENHARRLEEAALEVSRQCRENLLNLNGSIRSGAATPAPHLLDSQMMQTQLLQLIRQGHIAAAFQQALSASDLNLVIFVCKKTNPAQVFHSENGCVLQQYILLSLVQQLSADMTNHDELKQIYLEEAVMQLDPLNPTTRDHIPTVIDTLQAQLNNFSLKNPSSKIIGRVKVLSMAAQSLRIPKSY